MGFFSGIKSALSTAETGAKIVEKATDGIISGLGNLNYTTQEQAEAAKESARIINDMWKTYQGENTEQSKARRWLAKLTFAVFYSLIFVLILLYRIDAEWCKQALNIVTVISTNNLMLMVAGAYFIPHQLSKLGILGKKEK